ncbi:MAG: prenyltransferase/squalene oxidase repeat-containing protein [Thermomicrobiales bacterium]
MVNRRGRSLPVALLLVVLLALSASPILTQPAQAADPQPDAANAALDWLRTQQLEDGGFGAFGGESHPGVTSDAIYAFAAAGIHPNRVVAASGASALDYLLGAAGQDGINPGQAAKLVLALHVTGENPRAAGGVDLINAIELGLNGETGWYGDSFFGHTLAILALASQGAPIPDEAIDALAVAQTPEGSWGFNGDPTPGTGDSNTTAMAIQALVAVGAGETAIDAGLEYLRSVQNARDGSISYDSFSVGDPGGDANSTALAIQAFVAAGDDPATLEHGDLLAALLNFQNESGAFQFQPNFPDDSLLATAQAVPALLLKAFPYDPLPVESPLIDAAAPAAPVDGCVYYEITQHNVCEPFAAYWETHGGLANFGYPLTELVDFFGQGVQYFERAVFELHPENAGTEHEVLLTLVGTQEAQRNNRDQMERDEPAVGCAWHEPTGHNLCGGFAAFWEQFGGLPVFGYPVTDEFQESGLTVQYFERGRVEWHPGAWPERFDVLLGRLAAEALEREINR